MPEREVVERAKKDLKRGRSPTTAAGEFVREEMHHIREGKHGARSAKQAVAIGLSKARRAGIPLGPPEPDQASRETVKSARRDFATGQGKRKPRAPSARRKRAVLGALKREGHSAASHRALAKQARSAARQRTRAERSESARKAVRTKGPALRSRAAKKAAVTRVRRKTTSTAAKRRQQRRRR